MSSDEELKGIIQRGVRDGIDEVLNPKPSLADLMLSLVSALWRHSGRKAAKKHEERIEPIVAKIREERLLKESMATALLGRSALALPAIQDQVSTKAWLDRLKSLSFTDEDIEQQLQHHTELINDELIEMGLFPSKMRGLLPSLLENRRHMLEIEKNAIPKRELYGKFVKGDFSDAVQIASALVSANCANAEPEAGSMDDGLSEFLGQEFFRLHLQHSCPHTDSEVILASYDIWVDDFPMTYLKLLATEQLAFSIDNELVVTGEGWSVLVWFRGKTCCPPDEKSILKRVCEAIGGEIVDLR